MSLIKTGPNRALLSRRFLQGFLVRYPTHPISLQIIESIATLQTLLHTDNIPSNHSAEILGGPWHSFVCEAIVSLYEPSARRYDDVASWIVGHTKADWTFARTCLIGDLPSMQQALAELTDGPALAEDRLGFLQACFKAAITDNWPAAFTFLLSLKEPISGKESLSTAVESGRVDFVETLLPLLGDLDRNGYLHEQAIARIAHNKDPRVREQLFRLFYGHERQFPARHIKKQIFWNICLVDDVEVAAFMLKADRDVVDMITLIECASAQECGQQCALMIAARKRSLESLALMLSVVTPDETASAVLSQKLADAYKAVIFPASLKAIRLLLPHQTGIPFPELLLLTVQVDGGIKVMDDFYGPDCWADRSNWAVDEFDGRPVPSVEHDALRQAVAGIRWQNAELLLKRGFVPTSELVVPRLWRQEKGPAMRRMIDTFAKYGHKVADPPASHFPPGYIEPVGFSYIDH